MTKNTNIEQLRIKADEAKSHEQDLFSSTTRKPPRSRSHAGWN